MNFVFTIDHTYAFHCFLQLAVCSLHVDYITYNPFSYKKGVKFLVKTMCLKICHKDCCRLTNILHYKVNGWLAFSFKNHASHVIN